MRLSRFSDIGLRALMYLGGHPTEAVSATTMAHALRVSRDHLVKSLQALQRMDCVTSERGRAGGYRIAASAKGRRLGGVVRSLEPTLSMAECFEADSTCPLTGNCRLAGALAEAQRAFFDALDRYSLADLLGAEREHLVQLGIGS